MYLIQIQCYDVVLLCIYALLCQNVIVCAYVLKLAFFMAEIPELTISRLPILAPRNVMDNTRHMYSFIAKVLVVIKMQLMGSQMELPPSHPNLTIRNLVNSESACLLSREKCRNRRGGSAEPLVCSLPYDPVTSLYSVITLLQN